MNEQNLTALLRDHPNRSAIARVLADRAECLVLGAKLRGYGERKLEPEDADAIAELIRLGEIAAKRMQSGLLELHREQQKGRPKAARLLDALKRLTGARS